MPRSAHDCILLDPAAAAALADTPLGLLQPVVRDAVPTADFVALDDFDQTLRRSGRVLLEAGGMILLLQPDGAMLRQPGPRQGPSVSGLPEGPVKAALADLSPLRRLLVVGAGGLGRVTVAFVDDEGKSQVRLDLLSLQVAAGTALTIARPQALRGYPQAGADLRARIADCGGVPMATDNLCERLFPVAAVYDAKPVIALQADQTALDAATAIIAAYIPVARANEAGIIADHDTEFLHDYRIALRKIRSVLGLFRGVLDDGQTAELKARFSALMAPTGRLRDLDVALLEGTTYHDLLPKSVHAGLDAKFALLAEERRTARARLVQHLRRDGHAQEMAALEDLFATRTALRPGPVAALPARAFASRLIWKRYRRICRIARIIGPDTDDAEVHGLRIECKKLRYLMEFFAPLFPRDEFRALLKPLKALQDNLGLVNDCAVQQANLQLFLHGTGKRGRKVSLEVAQGVGALTAVLHRRQTEERTRTGASLAQFTSPQTARIFRGLFHAPKDRT